MTPLGAAAALAVGVGCAALAGLVRPPPPRLAGRVRPYAIVARAGLGLPPDAADPGGLAAGSLPRLFGPVARAALHRATRLVERRGDDHLARVLRQAGMVDVDPGAYRVRQLGSAVAWSVSSGVAVTAIARAPAATLVAVGAGFVVGATRWRRRVDRTVAERAARIRQELYTVNHLLAMHVRTGAGPIQAVQRIADRGHGAVVEELADVLAWTRGGVSEPDAFRRAAELTPEPSAARTYQLLAAGVERGADLGAALLALSQDLYDARREQAHRDAVRRRAAMLVPTIAILAPIMLLFIVAPLPSIVLGNR